MIHLALQTEYTFQKCYGHLEKIVNQAKERGDWALGIADKNNSFGHIKFNKLCKSAGIKPIFGIRLDATDEVIKDRSKYRTYNSIIELVFIAKNSVGLEKIYRLINVAYDQSYYFPRLTFEQVSRISDDILVIAPYLPENAGKMAARIDYKAISPATLHYPTASAYGRLESPEIALIKNEYLNLEDKAIYELLSSPRNTDIHTYAQHILSDAELVAEGISKDAISQTDSVAMLCNAEIPKADELKYTGSKSLLNECIQGAVARGVNLDNPEYSNRLQREISIIKKKRFDNYFLIVAEMINHAKYKMLVGPARGSSAGSLVCYLMGITEVDPLKYDLLFERFIDINRFDSPDIDTDFSDEKRQSVIKHLKYKYGETNVRSIGTVSTLKGRSAIVDFAKALEIPAFETEDFKDALIERNPGDGRFDLCIKDTFDTTEVGQKLLEKYPELYTVSDIEGHSRHAGKHAAGIIVSNNPLWKYGGINPKEDIVMMDKKDAESIGLLKIDALGLRTLSILEDTAELAGFDYRRFYKLPLDDSKVFEIFNKNRMFGIFQFEGEALQRIVKEMGVYEFNDIATITALARPGALMSGGTEKYIKYHTGKENPSYVSDKHKEITGYTHSIIVYQEQMMAIAREIGNMSWEDVSAMRKDINKKVGEEYYEKHYKGKFLDGCEQNGLTTIQANNLWDDILYSSLYSFNKSHSVSYAIISYWTAWCKAYHPLEFAAANLNHTKDDKSALRILRDFVVNDGIEYIPIDPDHSGVKWTIKDGKLLGGLTNIKGVGIRKAQDVIKMRKGEKKFTPAITKALLRPKTEFDILFPTKHYWGFIYDNPEQYNCGLITEIKDINKSGDYIIIGKLIEKELRDRNDYQAVLKRGNKVDENQFFMNLKVEDDTGVIKCTIPPYSFDQLNGRYIDEVLKEDDSWVLVKGSFREKWRNLSVMAIEDLEMHFPKVIK